MNRTIFLEALQSVDPAGNHCPDITALERQRASLKWQLQQQQLLGSHRCFGGNHGFGSDTGWLGANNGIIPRMSGREQSVLALPPVAASGMSMQVRAEEKVKESALADQKSGRAGDESLGKRKFNNFNIIWDVTEDDEGNPEKAESKVTAQSNNANNSEAPKPDYIHVRARRGQATDSHSLAERARREKISERMKFLQDLVPGCDKITGKAGMLDEIINYVQSLQRQVEFLSMKLAVVSTRLDTDIDSLSAKEMTPACAPKFPSIEMSSDLSAHGFLHFNPTNQLVSHSVVGLGVNPNPGIWRTISAPLPETGKFLETSGFTQVQAQSATWEDIGLQNLYNVEFQQGRAIPLPSQQYTGSLEAGNMKIQT